jgi:aspartyl-tRNA(Asn)/glutamyl-tRNA(Gln) amidotransferase subunit B
MMNFEAVIGLEVHLHLKTKTKAFCGCSTEFGREPNTQVCPICLGFPGSLPVLNSRVLTYAIKVALALNCQVQEYTKFDRKHYYYPDLPKNYQISQYDLPLSRDGFLEINSGAGVKRVGIRRVHMEEDAGKLIHEGQDSQVDFNRAGMPLLEIVSEPQINSAQEAYDYLTLLKSVLEYLDVSDCDMEKGSLRCDANISLREKGAKELGIKTELKNMNSFKAVKDALGFEIERQAKLLDAGERIVQDTRLWDPKEAKTVSMRTKEEAKDYRYFPEPDLPPLMISKEKIEEISSTIPELSYQKEKRFIREYGLSEYEAKILAVNKKDSVYFEECIKGYKSESKKSMVNFIISALLYESNSRRVNCANLGVMPQHLSALVEFIEQGRISNLTAKSVLAEMIDTRIDPAQIIQKNNLAQISDTKSLDAASEEAIKENPKSVADYQAGKNNALMFLVGQVMKKTGGKANPKIAQEILRRRLTDAQ